MPAQSGRTVGPGAANLRHGIRGDTVEVRNQRNLDRPDGPNGHYNSGHPGPYDRRQRSAYGIHNSFDKPAGPNPWPVRFIDALSARGRQIRMRYWDQSNSGQIPATPDAYATKLQTTWRSGGTHGSRADPIVQNAQIPTVMFPWPHSPGNDQPSAPYGMDVRNPTQVNGKRPMFRPRFEGGQVRTYSATSQRAGEYLPTRFSVVPPMRIVRMHRYGTGMMGGAVQFGTRQTWGQGEDCIVVSPVNVIVGMKSRGIISARGVLSPKQGTGRERIPALFTPSSVQ